MEPVRYFIPTRGRVGRQWTVKNLPLAVRPFLTIVCPREEASAHKAEFPDVCVVSQPTWCKTIGEKRQWIYHTLAANVWMAWQMDDDLKFKVLVDGRFVSTAKNYQQFSYAFERLIPGLWYTDELTGTPDPFPVVGIGTSYFAPKGGIRRNYHLGFAFGFNPRARAALLMGRLDVFEDIDYTLQMLRQGFPIAVTYDVTVDQMGADLPGGVTGERSLETIRRDLAKLIAYHPGIVSEKPRRPGAHPAAITKVLWAKAAKEGGLR